MATGKNIEKRSHIIGFKEEIDKASKKNGKSFGIGSMNLEIKETAFIRGSWDFSFGHIANRIAILYKIQRIKLVWIMDMAEVG